MSLLPDTSVWSLTFRRNTPHSVAEVAALIEAIKGGERLATTGLVLQELLQGFMGPKDRDLILDRFSALAWLTPDWDDHVGAADLRNHCRRKGVQISTVDAVLAQLCTRHDLTMLATDQDFQHIAKLTTLKLWRLA